MVISISIEDDLCVTVEVEGGYQPDVFSDMANRARDLFRATAADMHHLHAEHQTEPE